MSLIHKIPILTTLLSLAFAIILYRHRRSKPHAHHLRWWWIGIICYGLGTLTESVVALWGWQEWVFKSWYILGALLGGFPLAQGSVYLMFRPRTGHLLMAIVSLIVLITSLFVILSPIDFTLVEPGRLTGRVLVWQPVRWVTPWINLYAFVFLVGGAAWSAYRYSRNARYKARFVGNLLIAIGGLLPGIGGSFTKFGYTEVLYVTELIGLLLIYSGYHVIRFDRSESLFDPQQVATPA